MTGIFWNPREARLRAGWRLLLFGLLGLGISVAGYLVSQWEVGSFYANLVTMEVFGLVAALGSTWFFGRFVDRRRFVDFGYGLGRRWWGDFGFGVVLGGFLMAAIFGVELAAGWIEMRGATGRATTPFSLVPLVAQFLVFVFGSLTEETLCRGYLLRNLAEGLNLRRQGPRGALTYATLLSAVIFALLHWDNDGASTTSTLNIAVAGLLLALPVVLTGSLGLSVGLHLSWNFFEGPVFGFPVSGRNVGQTFFDIVQRGPVFWTGGTFGPEAGMLAILASALGAALIVAWVRWRYGRVGLLPGVAEYRPRNAPPEGAVDPIT